MESCANKYLHKKFKKQISEVRSHDGENNVYPSRNSRRNSLEEKCGVSVECMDKSDSVPKQSTNNFNSSLFCNVTNSEKSSISNVIKVNVIAKNGEPKDDPNSADATSPQSTNSCISYIISSRVDSRAPVEEPSGRGASFDTHFKATEPKQLKKSSISPKTPDGVFLTSGLSSTDRTEDISSPAGKEAAYDHSRVPSRTGEKLDSLTSEKNTGGKYVCTYCNLACSKPSVLQKHIRAHTNERPYPCLSCGSRFKTRSNLYKHCRSRTHANRVMGNKTLENNNDGDVDSHAKYEFYHRNDSESKGSSADNSDALESFSQDQNNAYDAKPKPYKPRFHTGKQFFDNFTKENMHEDAKHCMPIAIPPNANLSSHINEIINKNHFIVNSNENYILKKQPADNENSKEKMYNSSSETRSNDEPLNLSNKNRKRCLSEVAEPTTQKSLIKELLLKNLYAGSDMQCPHCKMLFQTVTELELHKLRSCKGFTKSGVRYSRSSSVNVASILTQNKNAFDDIPQLQDAFFPLKSPGPFLGKTRLIDSDKNKSFSFEDGIQSTSRSDTMATNDFIKSHYRMPLALAMPGENAKRHCVKLFGGEVKITQTSGESKSYKVDGKDSDGFICNSTDYGSQLSENRVVKSILHSGGTVLQNKPNYSKQDSVLPVDVIKAYRNTSVSPGIEMSTVEMPCYQIGNKQYIDDTANSQNSNEVFRSPSSISSDYTNIMDFSQKAAKSFAPNLKQLNLTIPGIPMPNSLPNSHIPTSFSDSLCIDKFSSYKIQQKDKSSDMHLHNPMTLLVNGKMVRYVPGMPGPVTAEVHLEPVYPNNEPDIIRAPQQVLFQKPTFKITPAEIINSHKSVEVLDDKNAVVEEIYKKHGKSSLDASPEARSPKVKSSSHVTTLSESPKKFVRPNSLALKPTIASMKQHHGLTPTVFNQILISPDTPRVAKKYIQHFLHGNYFSYLGLKSSTKSVYCTLNKTQPFYVPHFKKLSMYSEWRQQDTKADKLYVSAYDSRQTPQKYTTASQVTNYLVVHSSYKFSALSPATQKAEDNSKLSQIAGGYESNDDYTYIRGRGRGRYVCDQCGIRCKKPSMLKKHIRTHTNDRPYTCSHCNFSFKTKGNLTKHMKCKSHTKNCHTSGGSHSLNHPNSAPSSESDTDDSGMDSSDESSRQHEAAYGLLSLSQKTATMNDFHSPQSENNVFPFGSSAASSAAVPKDNLSSFMDNEEIVHVSKANFAKNKILNQEGLCFSRHFNKIVCSTEAPEEEKKNLALYLGKTSANRPLTYPYTSPLISDSISIMDKSSEADDDSMSEMSLEVMDYKEKAMRNYAFQEVQRDESCSYNLKSLETAKTMEDVMPMKNNAVLEASPNSEQRKRKLISEYTYEVKIAKQDSVMDLSCSGREKRETKNISQNHKNDDVISYQKIGDAAIKHARSSFSDIIKNVEAVVIESKKPKDYFANAEKAYDKNVPLNGDSNYLNEDSNGGNTKIYKHLGDYDNSAMETLADIATKQIKLEKNSIAKNVATEFLKLATKNESKNLDGSSESSNFIASSKDVNDLISKREENKSCTICSKNFSKPSQLRLHMNIHYLERPFRCDSCSVSFRTKGHLQKHERSASHHNKLSSSPALSSSEPRPFKCSDCNIAFRIHGHLAKHLRSKMHIMKLECLAKIPFGLYAELERSNSLLTEINTSDGDQCLESLKTLAKKVFINDPSKLNQLEGSSSSSNNSNN